MEIKIECLGCQCVSMSYTTLKGAEYARKHNVVCKHCKLIARQEKKNIIYKRNCPKCGRELTTHNKFWNEIAIKENRKCNHCSNAGRVFSEETKEKLKKNHADFSGEKNPFFGKTHSRETIKKLKLANEGKDRFGGDYKKLLKEKMTGKGNPFFGKTHSLEVKKLLSEPKTKEHIEKLRIANTGKRLSEETKNKISLKLKGRVVSEETREKMRISSTNRKHTDDSKIKMRKSAINRILHQKRIGTQSFPTVNPMENLFFEKMEKERGWDGIYHGKTGKQYYIESLGYFVDYYEPNLNIVVEYDEPRHYKANGLLKEKDVKRMGEIKNNLHCKFIRYNEKNNTIWECL